MTRIPSVSIIVPARDEAGTIAALLRRIPLLGRQTEVLFIEGFSTDGTWEEIQRVQKKYKGKLKISSYKQERQKGKRAAMELGFLKASGDILMILDADLSVDPESLKYFYTQAKTAPNCFVNGSRFIFPQEPFAMRALNNIGNMCFARLFSIILGDHITDTLCGTKVIWRQQWKKVLRATADFRHHDPYGDFSLFLGAYLLSLQTIEVPVVYRARVYGTTKISRFRDGLRLLVVLLAFLRFARKRMKK